MSSKISEFSLIDCYFKHQSKQGAIKLGIGDDCALLAVPEGYELAITTDTMVENVHFFADVNPGDLGHKLLAVNLSDLAAMGAKPLAVTLAITLPKADEQWLTTFASDFFALADKYQVDLIGGDTTSGPLTLTVQAFGLVPQGKALKRSSAKVGDVICVTGTLGNAGLGLLIKQGYRCASPEMALLRFNRPEPQVDVGQTLLTIASACIDISDGLAGDLAHILEQSGVGARIDWNTIPLSDEVKKYIEATGDWRMPLTAGDDYELCFTVSPEQLGKLEQIPHSKIGLIESLPGLRLSKEGRTQQLEGKGFEHFS